MIIMKFIRTSVIIFTFFKFARLELSSNFENCRKKFFYQETAPAFQGLKGSTQICQRLGNEYHYATDYDTMNRIPLYSAYILSFVKCGKRTDDWFFEAQLSDLNNTNMLQIDIAIYDYSRTSIHGSKQAVEDDYRGSDYDRGHLNPQMFNCQTTESRQATNTLTNIAPQTPSFNKIVWNAFETDLYEIAKKHCSFENARRYFITGVLPGDTYKSDERVNFPSHYWTAVCCDSSIANEALRFEGWSMAFIGNNTENSSVYIYTIQHFLVDYKYPPTLFADYKDVNGNVVKNCLFNPKNADKVIDDLKTFDKNLSKRKKSIYKLPADKQTKNVEL